MKGGHFLPWGPDMRAREEMLLSILRMLLLPVPVLFQSTVFCPWVFDTSFLYNVYLLLA